MKQTTCLSFYPTQIIIPFLNSRISANHDKVQPMVNPFYLFLYCRISFVMRVHLEYRIWQLYSILRGDKEIYVLFNPIQHILFYSIILILYNHPQSRFKKIKNTY